MTNELLRQIARGVFHADDPDHFRRKANRLLDHAVGVGDVHPDLTVKWAAHVASLCKLKGLAGAEEAIEVVLNYAEAAYRIAPFEVRNELAVCSMTTQNRQLLGYLGLMQDHLAPQLKPGPWGMREEGWRFIIEEMERNKSLWRRLGDFKHRLLNPPGPNDVTIGGPDDLRYDGP